MTKLAWKPELQSNQQNETNVKLTWYGGMCRGVVIGFAVKLFHGLLAKRYGRSWRVVRSVYVFESRSENRSVPEFRVVTVLRERLDATAQVKRRLR